MPIDAARIAKMKALVDEAKKAGAIIPMEKAFLSHPPEGTWHQDEDGKITVKEYNAHEV